MRLGKDEVRVYYQSDTGCIVDVEDFIRSFMRLAGYELYTSGMEMATGVRDLCFTKRCDV